MRTIIALALVLTPLLYALAHQPATLGMCAAIFLGAALGLAIGSSETVNYK